MKLAEKQRVFRRTIEDVEAELEMLSIHRENLEVNRDRIKLEEEEKARDLAPAGGGGGKQDKKGGPNKQEKVNIYTHTQLLATSFNLGSRNSKKLNQFFVFIENSKNFEIFI